MGRSNKICPNCGRKMKQQFIGLQHCKCGISWKRGLHFMPTAYPPAQTGRDHVPRGQDRIQNSFNCLLLHD